MGCGSSTATETSPDEVSNIHNGQTKTPTTKPNNTVANGSTKTTTQAKTATESVKQDQKPSNRSTENKTFRTSNEDKGTSSNLNIKPKTEALRFDYDDFKAIDDYAKQTPEDITRDVETLAKYLIKPAKNDLEKVRAFYVWICDNISYNTDSFFGGTTSSLDHSGNGTLKSRSSVCEGYSRLMEALCKSVGIECKKISGFAKGYGHRLGDVISFDQKTNHAWNTVKIEGKWRLIESTWGAGHVDKNRKYVKQFSNFYFLCPAEDFICDHFPYMNNNLEESNQWQLLKTPITIETYSQLLKPSKEARLYGFTFTSHPFTTIQVVKSTAIKINAPKIKFQDFFFDMYDSDGTTCNEAVIVLMKTTSEVIITVRPPKVKQYTLKLHLRFCDSFNTISSTIADYVIDCTAIEDNYEPYPTHRGNYGPSSDFKDRGFALTGIVPCMHCKNGEFKLQLTTTSNPQVLLHLHDSEGTDHKEYTLIEQDNQSINILARLVKKGFYKLTLFSKKDEKYTVAYNFLIENENEAERKSPFPGTYSSTQRLHCKLVQPLVRDIPSNCDVVIEFTSPSIEAIMVNKKVYTEKKADRWKVTTATGDSGDLTVAGKISGENSYKHIYVFTIKS